MKKGDEKMIKLMHVIYGLNMGGAETLIKDYALKIDKNKFNIEILCLKHSVDSPYEELLSNHNIKVIYLCDKIKYKKNNKRIISKVVYKIKEYLVFKKIIRKEKPDIIHSHLSINSFIRFAKPNKSTKLFYTVHNEPSVLWKKSNLLEYVDFKATKWLVKKYKMRFLVLQDDMRKEVNKLFNVDNSIILNNGIDFSRFKNTNNKKQIKEELNIPSNSYIIGHIGRFEFQKNHDFLIDVFNEIYKKNNNSFLIMIGSGNEKENIEKKLKRLNLDNKYLILSNRLDIPNLLNIMDAFVFPSIYEGLGMVLIEAQKMKLPCFISDTIPDYAIISNLVTTLSLSESPKEWAEKIVNYKYPQSLIFNDYNWDMEIVIKKLEDIYLN